MVILAAKSTYAPFRDVKRRISRVGLAAVRIGSGSYVCAKGSPRLSSSLEVLRAGPIVALITSVFGFHFSNGPSFRASDQPPSKYEVSPHLGSASRRISCLKSDHKEHRKRKWSTVSTLFSHLHSVEDAAPIVPRYRLKLQIPVRGRHRIAACVLVFRYIRIGCA